MSNKKLGKSRDENVVAEALDHIESLGAHPLLTDASAGLSDAMRAIAEWHSVGRPGEYK